VGETMSERTGTIGSPRALIEGERLDQPTFHALYEAMPSGTRAELINGVVRMPSPVGPQHGRAHVPTLVWLSYYQENTPGVESLDNTSTALGIKSEPQPDALLRILPEYGGRTQTDHRFVQGVPELLVEVAHTSRFTDLGPKFEDYERAGVLEYVVRAIEPDEVLWFVLRKGRFVELSPGPDGIYRSEAFSGL
jgi:Uma2 family endonuclease